MQQYEIRLTSTALRQFRQIEPSHEGQLVNDAIDALAANPQPGNAVLLAKSLAVPRLAVHVGGYCISYTVVKPMYGISITGIRPAEQCDCPARSKQRNS